MMKRPSISDLAWCFMMHSLVGTSCSRFDRKPLDECVRMTKLDDQLDTSKRPLREFIIDSGASIHCVNDETLLQTIYRNHPKVKITVANGQTMMSHSVGTMILPLTDKNGTVDNIVLHNVVYHPNFSENLISVPRLWKDNRISTKFGDKNVFKSKYTGKVYPFPYNQRGYKCSVSAVKVSDVPLETLHSRFGHCSHGRLHDTQKVSHKFPHIAPLPSKPQQPCKCDACIQGALRRRSFTGKRPHANYSYFGQRLSSDTVKMPASAQGYKYILCIVDAYTNWLVTVPLKSKHSDEVKAALEGFLKTYKRYFPTDKPITWHTDKRGRIYFDRFGHFL